MDVDGERDETFHDRLAGQLSIDPLLPPDLERKHHLSLLHVLYRRILVLIEQQKAAFGLR